MHEHTAHLGGLIGTSHPALDAQVRAPAGACTVHDGGQITGGETNQRIVRIQRSNDHLAHLAAVHRIAGARPYNLENDALVDDHALHGFGLVGNQSEIRRRIALTHGNAPVGKTLAQAGRQCLTRYQRFLDTGNIRLELDGLVENDIEKGRCAHVAGWLEPGNGLHLELRLAGAGGKHRTAQRMGT